MPDQPSILMEKENGIGILTLNREAERNTFTLGFAALLNHLLKELDQDDDVKVVVIQAAGKHFSTGIALDEFQDKSPSELRKLIKRMDQHNHTIPRMRKPVIASVRGLAIANGSGLVAAADLAIASENAKFGTTAINVGLICLGPAVPLSRIVSRKKLLEMVLAGDMIPAKEAERLGIVNQVVPDDTLETATMELAKKLAQKSPLAMECGKQGIYGMSDLPYHQAVDYMGEMFAQLCATKDATEGLQAFKERREPKWNRE